MSVEECLVYQFEEVPIGVRRHFMEECIRKWEDMNIEDMSRKCPNCLRLLPPGEGLHDQHYDPFEGGYDCDPVM